MTNLSGYFIKAAMAKQTSKNKNATVIPQLTSQFGGLPKMFWMAKVSSVFVSGRHF